MSIIPFPSLDADAEDLADMPDLPEGKNAVRDFDGEAPLPERSTPHLPGSLEKLRVLCERARRREALFHPDDGKGPVVPPRERSGHRKRPETEAEKEAERQRKREERRRRRELPKEMALEAERKRRYRKKTLADPAARAAYNAAQRERRRKSGGRAGVRARKEARERAGRGEG